MSLHVSLIVSLNSASIQVLVSHNFTQFWTLSRERERKKDITSDIYHIEVTRKSDFERREERGREKRGVFFFFFFFFNSFSFSN